jgi:hypothetical protein
MVNNQYADLKNKYLADTQNAHPDFSRDLEVIYEQVVYSINCQDINELSALLIAAGQFIPDYEKGESYVYYALAILVHQKWHSDEIVSQIAALTDLPANYVDGARYDPDSPAAWHAGYEDELDR